jgi:iron(III) transport system permease protein
LEERAQVSGDSWWARCDESRCPLMMPAMFVGWIGILVVTFRELTVSLSLVTPSSQVIFAAIWDFWENGSVSKLSAFTVGLSVIVLGLILSRMSHRYGYWAL